MCDQMLSRLETRRANVYATAIKRAMDKHNTGWPTVLRLRRPLTPADFENGARHQTFSERYLEDLRSLAIKAGAVERIAVVAGLATDGVVYVNADDLQLLEVM